MIGSPDLLLLHLHCALRLLASLLARALHALHTPFACATTYALLRASRHRTARTPLLHCRTRHARHLCSTVLRCTTAMATVRRFNAPRRIPPLPLPRALPFVYAFCCLQRFFLPIYCASGYVLFLYAACRVPSSPIFWFRAAWLVGWFTVGLVLCGSRSLRSRYLCTVTFVDSATARCTMRTRFGSGLRWFLICSPRLVHLPRCRALPFLRLPFCLPAVRCPSSPQFCPITV